MTNNELTPEQIIAIRAARAKYAREYRAKHPEKNKAAIMRYWSRKAAEQEQQGSV